MKPLPRKVKRFGARLAAAATLFAIAASSLTPAPALAAPKAGKVVIFVVDQVNLKEMEAAGMPHLEDLIKNGGVGLASVRSQVPGDPLAQYLSIGAGNKAIGLKTSATSTSTMVVLEGFGARESVEGRNAADIFNERTGRTFSYPQAANLSIGALIEANITEQTDAVPGALGDALKAAGLKTAVVGNADDSEAYNRSAIDILMNGQGTVDYGVLDRDVTMRDAGAPSGRRTDPDKLFAAFAAASGKVDVVAVEWGDTTRIREESDFITGGREGTLIKKSLVRADEFLGRILDSVDLKYDLVIVVTPTPSALDVKANRIVTPVVMAGPGIVGRGLLTSASTRRDAAIINIDIAPTILNHFGVKQPSAFTGRPVFTAGTGDEALAKAVDISERWVTIRNLMNPVLRGIAYWDIMVLILFMALLLPKRFRSKAAKIRWLLLSVPVIPLVVLLLPLLSYSSTTLVLLEIVAGTAAIAALVYWRARTPVEAMGIVGLSVAATLLIDLAVGGSLAQDSLLSYSVVVGARFYGLGNEYVGVLIGGLTLGLFYIMSWQDGEAGTVKKIVAVSLMLIATAMVGAPQLGAEFGGFLAAILGFGLMSLGYVRGGYKIRDLAILAVGGAAAVAAFVLYDLGQGAAAGSHIGRLASQIQAEGSAPLVTIIDRKVAMNIKLVQYAFWNWVNIASATALGLAFYGLRNLLKLVVCRYPYFKPTMVGGLSACVAALLFNDSGVVAMAMIFLYLVPAMLYLMTYEVEV
ncbi:MAG: hypothetical protein WC891_03435 [Actinomycetota bacterium]